jgi:ABC-type dipeptide/oligopeptide/nickel transport system ATPase component
MHLHPEEPEAGSWELLDNVELAVRVRALLPEENHALVLVDGRSGSGKSTFAERLARLLDGAVVHSDDIAWHHDPIHWEDVLVDGVIAPWRRGEAVYFRPPGWIVQGRPGAVEVPPRPVLVVEGVGAGRSGLAARAELVVWVQSDRDEARRRGLQRDVEFGRTAKEAEAFWDEWMRAEEPFLAEDRPWSRASLVVNGTPPGAMQASSVLASGPLNG